MKPTITEGRKLATFCTDPEEFKKLNEGIAPCQGWTNSATWCFNLYFMQEKKLHDAMLSLRRKDGTINLNRAARLMNAAQLTRQMEQIDDDSEGVVNVAEIVETFLADFGEE